MGGHNTAQTARTKGGTAVMVAVSKVAPDAETTSGVNRTKRDTPAREETYPTENHAQESQAQKMQSLGLLAAGMAHDFNNLLGVMIGYSEVLSERLKPGDPLRGYAGEVLKAGQQAASLTRQLLAFSRQKNFEPKVLNVNAVIGNMEQLLRRLVRQDIEVTFEPEPELGHVKADPTQIEQVIMNLAVNARDAMPRGGELRIETANVEFAQACSHEGTQLAAGRYVMMIVSDTGLGMDEKTKASIFTPFFTTKQSGKGTGLGLATIFGIVKQSRGSIAVRSQEGKGTSFMIYLPRVDEHVSSGTSTSPVATGSKGMETVLLADDAEPFRKVVKMYLEGAGYTVLEAQTSPAAAQIGAAHRGRIDLLLTDVIMPKVDGYQLSDYLRFHRPEMRILYMSGYMNEMGQDSTELKLGAPVLSKPFQKEAFLAAVRKILDAPREADASLARELPNGLVLDLCD